MKTSARVCSLLLLFGCASTDPHQTDVVYEVSDKLQECDLLGARQSLSGIEESRISYASRYGGPNVRDYPKKMATRYIDLFESIPNEIDKQCYSTKPATVAESDAQVSCWRNQAENLKSFLPRFQPFEVSNFDRALKNQDPEYPFHTDPVDILKTCFALQSSKHSDWEEAAQTADEDRAEANALRAEKDQDTLDASSEGLTTILCNKYSWLQANQKIVEEENELRRTAGVFDKARLYNAAKVIQSIKPSFEEKKRVFKKTSGKAWTPVLCEPR